MDGEMKELDILFEDEELVLLHKEAGIAVQTARTAEKDYVSMLKNYRAEKGEKPEIFVIHRLDQPVEGILLFAKNAKSAAELSGQMARGDMEKYYLALVTDRELPEEATLTDYLLKDSRTNLSRIVPEGTRDAKKAVLRFRKIETDGKLALVKIHLLTGRHHQIRAQMAHHGWQVSGDRKYGSIRENAASHPLALCAYRLTFCHPVTGEKKTFEISPKGEVYRGYRI